MADQNAPVVAKPTLSVAPSAAAQAQGAAADVASALAKAQAGAFIAASKAEVHAGNFVTKNLKWFALGVIAMVAIAVVILFVKH